MARKNQLRVTRNLLAATRATLSDVTANLDVLIADSEVLETHEVINLHDMHRRMSHELEYLDELIADKNKEVDK